MNLFEAMLLGLLQGLTEFLPVSSSAHLALARRTLGYEDANMGHAFGIAVHVGSLAAVLVFTRVQIFQMLTKHRRPIALLFVATLPLVAAIPLKGVVLYIGESAILMGVLLIVTGFVLYKVRWIRGHGGHMQDLSFRKAFGIGLAQLAGILPGVSRSGVTIAAGLRADLSRDDAVRFAFLMALPAIAGAFVYELYQGGLHASDPYAMATGGVTSFIASLVAMKVMVGVVQRRQLGPFAAYCWLVGTAAITAGILIND